MQDLGFETTVDEESYIVTVEGLGGKLPCEETTLNVGSAGTAARFLTATLGVSEGVFHMDSSEQMKRRPMDPLLSSLAELGCEVRCEGEDGHFPFTLTAHGFGQDHISIDIGHSSQFLSALLIASTLSSEDFMIQVEGTHGMAYIEMTQKMMEQFVSAWSVPPQISSVSAPVKSIVHWIIRSNRTSPPPAIFMQ